MIYTKKNGLKASKWSGGLLDFVDEIHFLYFYDPTSLLFDCDIVVCYILKSNFCHSLFFNSVFLYDSREILFARLCVGFGYILIFLRMWGTPHIIVYKNN